MSQLDRSTAVYAHGRPTVRGTRGMVASAHPLATLAGLEMLRQGGNAFDAAAATAVALNVVEPFMSGLAGLGMATLYTSNDQRVRCLDFHPAVPRAFDAASVSKDQTVDGPMASGVPGNLAGWCYLVRELGQLDLPRVFAPAIAIAEDGFATSPFLKAMTDIARRRPMSPDWRDLYLNGTDGGAVNTVFRQPDLARTLTSIAEEGPAYLYDGPLGEKMIAHMRSNGGCMSSDDLAAVQPFFEDPVSARFAGLDVHVPPPPATSFQFLLTMRILETAGFDGAAHLSFAHLDLVFRAIRIAAECRIENTKCSLDGLDMLLGDDHIASLCNRLSSAAATNARTEDYGAGPTPEVRASRDHTTSFSAVDSDGNAVCITQSLGSMYGSGVVIPGTGICMNNFMNWGDLNPQSPNFLKGGERFGMCLAPSISLSTGDFALALGTPGSYGILQTQAQAMVHHLVFGLDLQAAIDAPRARLWDGAKIDLESRVDRHVVEDLRRQGHDISQIEPFSMTCGGMQAISKDKGSGVLNGAADSRRDGAAMAY